MNIEEVLSMWKEDSIIDDLKLDDTTVKMARVHSKYLELITIAKMRRKKKDFEYKTLLKDKWLYQRQRQRWHSRYNRVKSRRNKKGG